MIDNFSFEQANVIAHSGGLAIGWASSAASGAEQMATFAGDSGADESGYESFDSGWGDVDPQQLVDAFGIASLAAKLVDRMDSWAVNSHIMQLGGSAAAVFDSITKPYEAFEEAWGAYNWELDLDEIQYAIFDGRTYDSNEWSDWETSLSPTEAAIFAGETFETFVTLGPQAVRVSDDKTSLQRTNGFNFQGAVGDQVKVLSTGDVPQPLTAGNPYYVHSITGSAVRLTLVAGGGPVTFADVGNGQITVVQAGDKNWPLAVTM